MNVFSVYVVGVCLNVVRAPYDCVRRLLLLCCCLFGGLCILSRAANRLCLPILENIGFRHTDNLRYLEYEVYIYMANPAYEHTLVIHPCFTIGVRWE